MHLSAAVFSRVSAWFVWLWFDVRLLPGRSPVAMIVDICFYVAVDIWPPVLNDLAMSTSPSLFVCFWAPSYPSFFLIVSTSRVCFSSSWFGGVAGVDLEWRCCGSFVFPLSPFSFRCLWCRPYVPVLSRLLSIHCGCLSGMFVPCRLFSFARGFVRALCLTSFSGVLSSSRCRPSCFRLVRFSFPLKVLL